MRALTTLVLLLTLASSLSSRADEPAEHGIPQYQHVHWTLLEGAPADIWAMTQTDDDMLWLGTGSGLYRFDGYAFSRQEAPRNPLLMRNITALTHTADRTLWIGYFSGGIAALRDGQLRFYPPGSGVPRGMVFALAPDQSGRLWAATSGGLAVFDGTRWSSAEKWGYTANHAYWVMCDSRGSVWAISDSGVFRLPMQGARFIPTGIATGPSAVMAESPAGDLWLSDARFGTRSISDHWHVTGDASRELGRLTAKRLWFDRDGSLWGTDASRGGVFRLAAVDGPRPLLSRFDSNLGLTSNVAVPGLADVEGNVWVGTNLGLNRFRRRSVLMTELRPPLSISDYSWAWGRDGAMYLNNAGAVYVATPSGWERCTTLPRYAPLVGVANGTYWAISRSTLIRQRNAAQVAIDLPAQSRGEHVLAFALSDRQTAYLAIFGQGLFALKGDLWEHVETGRRDAPVAIAIGADNTLWLGFSDGRVVHASGERLRAYGIAQGLRVGSITALALLPSGLYVAGENGLAWLAGDRFKSLTGSRLGDPLGVSGITQGQGDIIWLNSLSGALRVSRRELDRGFAAPNEALSYRLLDAQDGLAGVAIQSTPVSTAMSDARRIWLATNAGMAWLSEADLQSSAHPPKSKILGVRGNGIVFRPSEAVKLPANTNTLQVDFTAASLSTPQRVRFRYWLEGVDDHWHETTSRQATYSNLAPGRYRFIVSAANSDALWSEPAAEISVIIAPAFWQSPWFASLCVGLLAALLYLGYWHRLHQQVDRMRARVAERYLERERIARELHDTLLQGLQGLILRLGSLANHLPDAGAQRDLEGVVARAEDMLVESRDRVSDMRAELQPDEDLRSAFARIGEDMALDSPVTLHVSATVQMPLAPMAHDEIYRIGREAILNAYYHAQARHIDVLIDYQPRALTLSVRDDGIGMDIEQTKTGRRGHWGLSGMRERAKRLEATLSFQCTSGMHVELVVPGRRAYATRSLHDAVIGRLMRGPARLEA